jgi:hypothetical protein
MQEAAELGRAEALQIPADLDYSALQLSNQEVETHITLEPADSFVHVDGGNHRKWQSCGVLKRWKYRLTWTTVRYSSAMRR